MNSVWFQIHLSSSRIKLNYDKIKKYIYANPNNWKSWKKILTSKNKKKSYACINRDLNHSKFGTISSSIVALPDKSIKNSDEFPIWMYTDTKPDENNFFKINIGKIFKNIKIES